MYGKEWSPEIVISTGRNRRDEAAYKEPLKHRGVEKSFLRAGIQGDMAEAAEGGGGAVASYRAMLLYPQACSPLEKGRAKGAGWMRRSRNIWALPMAYLPASRFRLCEADPSPGLWPSPFSKGELAYRYIQ